MHKREAVINSSFLSRDFSIDQDYKIMVFYMKNISLMLDKCMIKLYK